jgi:ParB family chromosome partitioning protein
MLNGEGITRKEIIAVEVAILATEQGLNIREDMGDLNELAASIAANGVKIPLVVKADKVDGKVIIVDGHRRFKAILVANRSLGAAIKRVPCMVEGKGITPADRLASQFITNSGKPLTTLEEAKGIKQLIDWGWSMKEVATKLGKSNQWVSNRLALHNAPKEVKDAVAKGEMTTSAGVQIARADNPEQVAKEATKKATKKATKEGEEAKPAKVKVADVQAAKEDAGLIKTTGPKATMKGVDLVRAFDQVEKLSAQATKEEAKGMKLAMNTIKQVLNWKE